MSAPFGCRRKASSPAAMVLSDVDLSGTSSELPGLSFGGTGGGVPTLIRGVGCGGVDAESLVELEMKRLVVLDLGVTGTGAGYFSIIVGALDGILGVTSTKSCGDDGATRACRLPFFDCREWYIVGRSISVGNKARADSCSCRGEMRSGSCSCSSTSFTVLSLVLVLKAAERLMARLLDSGLVIVVDCAGLDGGECCFLSYCSRSAFQLPKSWAGLRLCFANVTLFEGRSTGHDISSSL